MSNRPARIRAITVAVLVLAFAIPWTYAHIAYAWPWKEKSTGEACTGNYYLTPYDKQRSMKLGTILDGGAVAAVEIHSASEEFVVFFVGAC